MHHDHGNGSRARAARIRSEHHWEATELDAMHRRAPSAQISETRRRPRFRLLLAALRPFRTAGQP